MDRSLVQPPPPTHRPRRDQPHRLRTRPHSRRRQGRGLAIAAARTLIDRARDRGATRVIAHTLATPNASTAVLVRCGFTRTATIADPDPDPDHGVDDDVWRCELLLS